MTPSDRERAAREAAAEAELPGVEIHPDSAVGHWIRTGDDSVVDARLVRVAALIVAQRVEEWAATLRECARELLEKGHPDWMWAGDLADAWEKEAGT